MASRVSVEVSVFNELKIPIACNPIPNPSSNPKTSAPIYMNQALINSNIKPAAVTTRNKSNNTLPANSHLVKTVVILSLT